MWPGMEKAQAEVDSLLVAFSEKERRFIALSLLAEGRKPRAPGVAIPADQGWRGIDDMPLRKTVEILSPTGKVAMARVRNLPGREYRIKDADRYGPRRIYCYRVDEKAGGDIWAIAWR